MRPDTRLPFLDVLRALAILLVMFCHHIHLTGAPPWYLWFATRAHIGVDVFFVLSGYLIGGQLLREFRRTGTVQMGRFWCRRWLRTLPVYYVMLAPLALGGTIAVWQLSSFLLFAQNYTAPQLWEITWSLCIEEHFYLALPLVVFGLARLPRFLLPGAVAALLLLSPALRWMIWQPVWNGYEEFFATLYVPTHLRLDGLALGVLIAALQVWKHPIWQWCAAHARTLGLAGALLFVITVWSPLLTGAGVVEDRMGFLAAVPLFSFVSLGVAGMLIYGVTRASARWAVPGMAWISDHAYSLYIIHLPAQALVLDLASSWGFFPTLVLSLFASCAFAYALRRVVEVRGLRLRERLFAVEGKAKNFDASPVLATSRVAAF